MVIPLQVIPEEKTNFPWLEFVANETLELCFAIQISLTKQNYQQYTLHIFDSDCSETFPFTFTHF